ncbi:MAG: hypothetical protein LH660_03050 [Phormidesmis sp. CAN_BIN36]|nr:hypothetical protein [Phormidesmis sp. CAN_BIN36]
MQKDFNYLSSLGCYVGTICLFSQLRVICRNFLSEKKLELKNGVTVTLEEAIKNLTASNIDENNDWYSWREINEEDLPNGIGLPQGNQYVKNIALKKALHEKWKNTIDHEEKKLVIKYYISTWGGIHGNSSDTIERYSRSGSDELINLGSNGIASWSKALCVHDPKRYAIFDARVSASLNSLQIIHGTDDKVLFPVLTSRNKTIKKGIRLIKEEANNAKWKNAAEFYFYREYLEYLGNSASALEENLCASIYTVEMLLFSKAEELVRQAFPNEEF